MTCEPDRCSQASEEWTSGSQGPDSSTRSSASQTNGDDACSPITGPESPSTETYEMWVSNQRRELRQMPVAQALAKSGGLTQAPFVLISSQADSPARTSASRDAEPDSPGQRPASSLSSLESSTLFDLDGFSSRTFRVSSLATAVGTSESCLERWPTSGTAWDGGFSTHVSSECRSDADGCSSSEPALTEILEPTPSVQPRFFLSARAAAGILKRSDSRGKALPQHLRDALTSLAASPGHSAPSPADTEQQTSTATAPTSYRARRLTPLEYERLQGVPDGWTAVLGERPDQRRYSAMGDAVSVPVAEWIGRRLLAQHVRRVAA